MEEVLEQFENTVISQESPNDDKTTFQSLYKNWGKLGNQEERRKEILEVQKGNRNNKLDRFRGILELVKAVEESQIFQTHKKAFEQLKNSGSQVGNYLTLWEEKARTRFTTCPENAPYIRPSIYVAGFNKTSPTYSNVLMQSEWIIEKPEDFNENWYVVPCPKGVRTLVVANNGSTKCYTKYGHFKFVKRSALPGGHPCDSKMRNRCCVLDCFYSEKINTLFVLDLLAWNNQPMTDGETEFRHYWLETQMAELPDLKVINKKNQIIFKLLPKVPCSPDSFNKFMSEYPPFENNFPEMDGLLFYHKRAHYVAGETPLVGWLYPYMVPEVLGSDISINGIYLASKPTTYVNQADFIEKFEAKHTKKKDRSRKTSTQSMDTTDENTNEVKPNGNTKPNNGTEKPSEITEKMDAEEVPTQHNDDEKPTAPNLEQNIEMLAESASVNNEIVADSTSLKQNDKIAIATSTSLQQNDDVVADSTSLQKNDEIAKDPSAIDMATASESNTE